MKLTNKNKSDAAKVVGALLIGLGIWQLWPSGDFHWPKFGNPFGNKFGSGDQDGKASDNTGSGLTKDAPDMPGGSPANPDTKSSGNVGRGDNAGGSGGDDNTDSSDYEIILKDKQTGETSSLSFTNKADYDAYVKAHPGQVNGVYGFNGTMTDFISTYKGLIAGLSKKYQIQPGVILAVAGVESTDKNANGDWVFGSHPVAQDANNFFNIKADASWRGDTYQWNNAMWRSYPLIEDSIKDVYDFLATQPNYRQAGLFNSTSITDQANALQKAHYAGDDTNYAKTLIPIAQKAQLVFDASEDNYKPKVKVLGAYGGWISIAVGVGLIMSSDHIFSNAKKGGT